MRRTSVLVLGLLLLGWTTSTAEAHGWGTPQLADCADCGGSWGHIGHGHSRGAAYGGCDDRFNKRRFVRFWGGPKRPLPMLGGTPGYWDDSGGWMGETWPQGDSAPYVSGQAQR